MKFKLTQEKLINLLEKLMLKDAFKKCTLTVRDGMLFSIEKEQHGRALRFLKINKSYFDEIDDSNETIALDLEKTLSVVKNILPTTELTFEKVGEKISITGENINAKISYENPQGELLTGLPFEINDDGVPIIGEAKIPLDTYLRVDLQDFKDVANYGNSLGTEFYKFFISGDKIATRIGDLHNFSDYVIFNPNGDIKSGKELNVFFTYGIPQIAGSFSKEVNIKVKTNSPGWFYEKTDDYTLGVLIPPYVPKEDE